jgi:hypothetical protein
MTELVSPRVRSLGRWASEEPDAFWAAAAEALPWFRRWDTVLKAVTLDRDPGDISTIEDEGSVGEAREAWETMRREIGAGTPGAPGA